MQRAEQSVARSAANPHRRGAGSDQLGYQKHRYSHPCDLLDPYRNLAIAAEILREQHTPGEDWLLAIGRYHRPAGGAPPRATGAASVSTWRVWSVLPVLTLPPGRNTP
ncbi:hypothetical protein IE981_14840 [Klebsiella pneumoniae]|nr:hypothetical protein [Klebsiella pneumoniae]